MLEFSPRYDRRVEITYVGHATALVAMDGIRVLTDPVLRRRMKLLRRQDGRDVRSEDLLPLDAILLSHMHFDHMDHRSLRWLPRDVPLLAPRGASRFLRGKVPQEVVEMGPGEEFSIGPVKVHAAPSHHRTGFYWPFWYPVETLSFLVEGSRTVYFAGDTALHDGMTELRDRFAIDAALLPVWGFGPTIRGDHMDPWDAACAVSLLGARVAIPIHWGTYRPVGPWFRRMSYMADPPKDFADHLARLVPEASARILAPGETTVVG